jgi:hypothetical protein
MFIRSDDRRASNPPCRRRFSPCSAFEITETRSRAAAPPWHARESRTTAAALGAKVCEARTQELKSSSWSGESSCLLIWQSWHLLFARQFLRIARSGLERRIESLTFLRVAAESVRLSQRVMRRDAGFAGQGRPLLPPNRQQGA